MRPETVRSLRSAAAFLLKLNALALPLYLVTHLGLSFQPLQDGWALMLGQSLGSMGYETAVQGSVVAVQRGSDLYQLSFSWDSTGWKSMYAMFALVFASGVGTLGRKLRFLAFAVPLVAFVNLLRVASTAAFSVETGFVHFDLVHGLLWSALMVAFVVCAWYLLFFRGKS
jgi:exosortase/archaeosortase family protein